MKIANADKLIHHFESCVDVKLFTVPEIITIINSFSIDIDIPKEARIIMPREVGQNMVYDIISKIMNFKPGIDNKLLSEEQISEGHEDD